MFYCPDCQSRLEWPKSLFRSYGKCEMCGKVATCYDVPSSCLPMPKRTEEMRRCSEEVRSSVGRRPMDER